MEDKSIIKIKENKLQKDCFMHELKELMQKYNLKSISNSNCGLKIKNGAIKAENLTFELEKDNKTFGFQFIMPE